ncbi:MAG: hypothetical protein GTO55_08870 [Armatimonadetes bacterium]|nr:hypothetical protein [Armatimonadota bacterium]NIM24359.1 hypothetical protein [Armatimonadota bacterium]NIM68228.1 hypothetical protein [Armatimonadota bacterium]NIM75129.1 hypothetical protein [Armatimonadota bacterium]NIN06433.1 hypothetical protein [Armatimonadota bacterium]
MNSYVELLPTFLTGFAMEQGDANSAQRLKEACAEFEAIFLTHMLRCMKATVPDGGLLPKSSGEKIFEDMFDEQIAREIAKTGTLGLADILLRDLAGPEAEGAAEG